MATVEAVREQRVVLHNVSWQTYECLMKDLEDSSVPHFTYDRGALEILIPTPRHERYRLLFDLLLMVIAEELEIHLYGLGSTTYKREDLRRGFEADSCYYFENPARVRGKDRLDLTTDPPPDLVIEIDITNRSLYKLSIYGDFGVPEVWRYGDGVLQFWLIEDVRYVESARSRALPMLSPSAMSRFMEEIDDLEDLAQLRQMRRWVRSLHSEGDE